MSFCISYRQLSYFVADKPCSLKRRNWRRIFETAFWDGFCETDFLEWTNQNLNQKNAQVPCLANNQSKSVSSKFRITKVDSLFSPRIYSSPGAAGMGPCCHASLAIYVGVGFTMGPCHHASLKIYVGLSFNMGPCHHTSLAILVGLGFSMGPCHHASLAV